MPNKRIERIIKRAIAYNNGLTPIDAFAILEEEDGANDGQDDIQHISYIKEKEIIKAINKILDKDDASFLGQEPKPKKASFSITLDEFNALPLYEQNKLFQEHPDEIKELICRKPTLQTKGQITKDKFLKMPKEEQEWYYENNNELVKALFDGRLAFIDSEA